MTLKHNDPRCQSPDPEEEALVRLRAARKLLDHLLSGRWPASLTNVAHVATLIDQAKSLMWAAEWKKVA